MGIGDAIAVTLVYAGFFAHFDAGTLPSEFVEFQLEVDGPERGYSVEDGTGCETATIIGKVSVHSKGYDHMAMLADVVPARPADRLQGRGGGTAGGPGPGAGASLQRAGGMGDGPPTDRRASPEKPDPCPLRLHPAMGSRARTGSDPMTRARFNRRMRKTARLVVWKGRGAQSPRPHPIDRQPMFVSA